MSHIDKPSGEEQRAIVGEGAAPPDAATGHAAGPAAGAASGPAADDREHRSRPDLTVWAESLLTVARHLGLPGSPTVVRNTTAWAGDAPYEQSIVEIAQAAGLDACFVDLARARLHVALLPALIELDRSTVGIVIRLAGNEATLLIPLDGKVIERTVGIGDLGSAESLRLLLTNGRSRRDDDRLDSHMMPVSKSWLSGIFADNWRTIGELGIGSLAGNLLAVGTSLFSMQVWDRVVPARSTNTLWVLFSGVLLALIFEFLIRSARASLADHFGKRADMRLSAMFYAHVLAVRNDARPRSPSTIIAQLRDLEQLRELLTSSTLGVLLDLPFVLAFLVIIWILGGPLVLVPLATIPLIVVPGLLAQIPLARLSREGTAESALRSAILMESVYRIEDIKTLQAEPRFRHLWDKVNRVNGEIGLKQKHLASQLLHFSQLAQQLGYVGVYVVGAYGILDGSLSFGVVLASAILTSRTIAPLAQISAVLGRLQSARVGKQALDGLLSLPTEAGADAYHRPVLTGQYGIENVVYSFSPDSKPALMVSDLKIKAGERIAILGRVGAGKSTLLRLAGGLATPVQGRIVLDGTPMNLIDAADVRRDVGIVLQESNLFYGTIRENLLIADPLASDDALLEAMRIACADQLLLGQPLGLDFRIRENGVGLSGGQRQALVLARTFLRAPNILLLDEPTASLDEATESVIIQRLGRWLGNRTLIVATHRYSVLSLVDRIIVLDGGRVAIDGPKDQVLQRLREGASAR